jgi:hypothetical protein
MDLEHERRLTDVEARSKSNAKRLDDMEKRQDDLEVMASSLSVLAAREERVENDVKEIKADVKSLASKPGKRWESLEEKVILAIAAAVIGFILAQVGLG